MIRVTDSYGRPMANLRISVTNECNYRCIFCHIEGDPIGKPLRPGQLPPVMIPREYGIVAKAAWLLGIRSYKITGGEPLIRRDIVDIVGEINENSPGSDISMTTNGFLMNVYAEKLASAGLRRANISIHSLRRARYKFITGVDGLDKAMKGLSAAHDAGLKLKVNMVVLKGINEDEVLDIAEYAAKHEAMLQLIELHPVGMGAKFFKQYFYPVVEIEKKFLEMGAKAERRGLHNRPVYTLPNGIKVEVVRPHGNPIFCAGCTRIRLSATGHLTPCLNWKGERIHLLPRLRAAESLEDAIIEAARAILEVNTLRRPYFLPRRSRFYDPLGWPVNGKPEGRIDVPKRSLYQRVLQELESQIRGIRTQVATS
ncbi:MAG: GTP 3',8-cyclase MoaA [Desulfurococcales archaeon]|nr:GTP 3',8-cyclase MoaA [Desulfurococcales archaeon]